MLGHGICGVCSLPSFVTLAAASPMISMDFTRASTSFLSSSRELLILLFVKCMHSFAASSIWRNRIRSSFCILYLRLTKYFLSEISTKILWCSEINFSSQYPGQFYSHSRQSDKSRYMVLLEFNEQINIAI